MLELRGVHEGRGVGACFPGVTDELCELRRICVVDRHDG
jgi:hypothetical protein